MNVIFLDFDGVLCTYHSSSFEDMEKRIKILSVMCKILDCKVVIEASAKCNMDEETMEYEGEYLTSVFSLFTKYGVECIGRTPSAGREFDNGFYTPIWKEYEIKNYLNKHAEVEHFVVIDDNDGKDLELFKDHLVSPLFYSENKDEEGLLYSHMDEVRSKLLLENKISKNKKHFS